MKIIRAQIEGEALATLVVNKLRGTLNAAAVRAPVFGDRRKAMLEDIAILAGGKRWVELIVEGYGKPADIEGRVKVIRARSRKAPRTTT
ncbi:MAG TPA: hypothetical protein VN317_08255, partial [Candidatus Methanoperedens sp.]|nr:hypothetical protein [Candidatus Methanoperedens sp.]